jgi:uncharacterized protein (DUF58 family)
MNATAGEDAGSGHADVVLRELELICTKRLSGLLHGDYRGILPGSGSELADTRIYEPGDDVRRIDWAATARCGQTQLRTQIEDRELNCYLVADVSSSMDFGTRVTSKRRLAAAALAGFGFLAARGSNRVGGAVISGEDWQWVVPRTGRSALQSLLHSVLTASGAGTSDLAGGLERVGRLAKMRGLVVIVSDLVDVGEYKQPLGYLAMHHDVVVVEIIDEREKELVNVGFIEFVNPETGERQWVDTSNAALRQEFLHRRELQREEIRSTVTAAGAELLVLHTDSDWVAEIVTWLRWRKLCAGAPRGKS